MIPENATMIDVAKRKELFEYEMTEVLLNLKGDFAAFSGEGTAFAESSVADERLIIPSVCIPEAAPVAIRIELSVQCPNKTCVPFSVNREPAPLTQLKAVKKPVLAQPVNVERQPVSVWLPHHVPHVSVDIKSPVIEQVAVSMPVLPQIKKPSIVKVSGVPVSVEVPELPALKPVCLANSAVRQYEKPIPKVDPPAAKARIPSLHLDPVNVSLPAYKTMKVCKAGTPEKVIITMPTIPYIAPVPCFCFSQDAGSVTDSLPNTVHLQSGDAADLKLNNHSFSATVSAELMRALDIPVPDFKKTSAVMKPLVQEPIRLPALPDLSIPTPPEISI